MTKPKQITIPFANSGLKNDLPDSNGEEGQATWQDGFPQITMLPLPPDGTGVPPDGMDMNGVLYAVSKAAQFSQMGVLYKFDDDVVAAIGGYPKGAVLLDDAETSAYLSLIDANAYNFNEQSSFVGQYWQPYAGAVTLTTLTVTGTGNAVTDVTSAGNGLTVTKGNSFLPLTGGTMTGIVNNTASNPYRKIAQNIDLSTTDAGLREDFLTQIMPNPADSATGGSIAQIGAQQPANSKNLFIVFRVGDPRRGNLPTGDAQTSPNFGGIGVFYDYETNKSYGYLSALSQRPTSETSENWIASTGFVNRRVPKSIGSATKPVYTNGDGVITACSYTLEANVPSGAKFTDTVTTATTSGTGNAVTAVTASNGALTVTKGNSFLPLTGGNMTGSIKSTASVMLSGGSVAVNSSRDVTAEDANNVRIGFLRFTNNANNHTVSLTPVNFSNSPAGGITLTCDNNGAVSATAPTPAASDNSTKIATTAYVKSNLGSYLPLSGGTMTGVIVKDGVFARAPGRDKSLSLFGSADGGEYGAALYLFGGANDAYKGGFILRAGVNGAYSDLRGAHNDALAWRGRYIPVMPNANIMIQYGTVTTSNATVDVTFSTPFSASPQIFVSIQDANYSARFVKSVSSTKFTISIQTAGNTRTNWLAIGAR